MNRTDWREEAACRGQWGLFHAPDGERAAQTHRRALQAKAICATCPVISQCLRDALDHNDRNGIWGGTSERQRRRLLAEEAAA